MSKSINPEEQLERMRREWDERARKNARYYVNTSRTDWSDQDFFASGEKAVAEDILTDTINIYQGKDPAAMRVLEIGCGAGRLTWGLSNIFGENYAVDVSGEMVRARAALAPSRGPVRVHIYQNNGRDLSVIPQLEFDFAYSAIVFQHIPSREIIENYVREVCRLLRPGARCSSFRCRVTSRCRALLTETPGGACRTSDAQLPLRPYEEASSRAAAATARANNTSGSGISRDPPSPCGRFAPPGTRRWRH